MPKNLTIHFDRREKVSCCFPTRGRLYHSQEVFSSTESDEGEEEEDDDSGEDNEGDHEVEDEDEDDEVFVQLPPSRSKQPRGARPPPRRNGEISPPLSASPAAPTTVFGKNSAANHGVKMVEGVGGDVADVLEVRAIELYSFYPFSIDLAEGKEYTTTLVLVSLHP